MLHRIMRTSGSYLQFFPTMEKFHIDKFYQYNERKYENFIEHYLCKNRIIIDKFENLRIQNILHE